MAVGRTQGRGLGNRLAGCLGGIGTNADSGGLAWSAWVRVGLVPRGIRADVGMHGGERISWERFSALDMHVPETDTCVQHDSP